jgi:phospholipase/carboxylesterase
MITDNAVKIEPPKTADSSIIWLHGLGADGHDFASLPQSLSHPALENTRYIFPHAPVRPVTLNGFRPMRAWYDITSLTREGRQDVIGLEATHRWLEQLIQEQLNQDIPAKRILLGGFSQGGAQALYSGTRTTHRIAGIVGLSCYLPDKNNTPPSSSNRSILIMHGDDDDVVIPELGRESAEHLRALQYTVDFQRYRVAHTVHPEQLIYLNDWLGKQLAET